MESVKAGEQKPRRRTPRVRVETRPETKVDTFGEGMRRVFARLPRVVGGNGR